MKLVRVITEDNPRNAEIGTEFELDDASANQAVARGWGKVVRDGEEQMAPPEEPAHKVEPTREKPTEAPPASPEPGFVLERDVPEREPKIGEVTNG